MPPQDHWHPIEFTVSCYRYSTVSQHELKVPDAEKRTTDLFRIP